MTLSHSYSAKSDSRFKDYGVRNGSRSKRIKMASAKGIDPKLKNLKIKTGVVKRLAKEKIMYEKEVVDQEAKIEKMKAENKDEYDIKKQVEVLQESKNMVPDCQRRLERAIADLKAAIEDCGEFKDSEVYTAATEQLEAVSSS